MPNNAGAFDDRITILKSVVNRGNYGEQSQEWSELCKCWAKVTYKRGQRAIESGEVWLPNTIVVTIRYRSDVDDRMRLVVDGDTYAIDSLNSRRKEGIVQITCTKIDSK